MLGGQRSVVLLLGLVVAAVVLSVLHNTGVALPIEGLAQRATAPIRGAFNALGTGISNTITDLQQFGELREENEVLRADVAELEAAVARMQSAARENELLREALGFVGDHPEYVVVTAPVVARDSLDVLETIIIDRGASSGIRVGMAVVANGSLAGRITSVTDTSADVLPVYSTMSSVSVVAQGPETEADGILDGEGAGSLVMRRIEPEQPVTVGDFVVTSGLGGGFPRGIPIGQVRSIERSAATVFREAIVEPFIRPDRLDLVQVILGQQAEAPA